MKLSDYVFRFLKGIGVKNVFMLSGGGCMHLCDSLGRSGMRYVCCLHEQAAALAAVGCAQYTRDIGVVLATTGPGGTNTVTGIASAFADSVPLLVLTGQVKTADMSFGSVRTKGFQEIDIVSVTRPITKYAVTVTNPDEIRFHLEKAIFLAKDGRPGPVLLDIPLDVQSSGIEESGLKCFAPARERNMPDKCAETAAAMIKSAGRPVFLAGYGISAGGHRDLFVSIAERLRVPVLSTWKAMDLMPDDHPDFYGRPGNIANRGANFIQQNADLIVALGARLDFGQIGYEHEKFAPGAKKIIVDADGRELEKFKFHVDLPVNAGVGEFLEALGDSCGDFVFQEEGWLGRCREWRARYPVISGEHYEMKGFVSQYALMGLLSDYSGPSDVFAPGNSGGCSEIFMQAFKVKEGQRIVSLNGIGSMGTGLPMAIGAAVASGRRVICVNGDGGFQMNIQDLETIRRLKLPVKFFILNNDGYNSIRQTQTNYFDSFFVGSSPGSGVTLPDTLAVAAAYRIPSLRVSSYGELRDNFGGIMDGDGPFICEVMVDPDEKTLPRLQSSMDSQGRLVSGSQENLYPFLSESELQENMLLQ